MNIYSQIQSNRVKTFLIMAVFSVLVVGAFYLFGLYSQSAEAYLLFGIGFTLFSSISSYYFSDRVVLSMAGAKKADKQSYFDYYTVTENLAIASGIPMPALYVIEDEALNAFATGRNPQHAAVAATTGLLKRLERAEIEGVIAHELAHIRNYDTLVMTIVAVMVGSIGIIADFITHRLMWGGRSDRDSQAGALIGIISFIVLVIVMPIIAMLIQFAISRRREYLADASGALLTRNPEGLARALEKISSDVRPLVHATPTTAHLYISNPFKKGSKSRSFIDGLFSTHPPAEERIRILRGIVVE